jgi:hypothetical protein
MYSSNFAFKQVVSSNFSAFCHLNRQMNRVQTVCTLRNPPCMANPGLDERGGMPAGAAYGAMHRASDSHFGFLLKLIPARKRLWGRETTPKTIGHTNRINLLTEISLPEFFFHIPSSHRLSCSRQQLEVNYIENCKKVLKSTCGHKLLVKKYLSICTCSTQFVSEPSIWQKLTFFFCLESDNKVPYLTTKSPRTFFSDRVLCF